jgi:FkbM family methyltransferase
LIERIATAVPDSVFVRTIALVHPLVEREMLRVVEACPRDGTAVDVGAWYGPWTRRLSRRVDSVVAFEANPKVAGVLRATAPPNAVVHAVAVSDRDGETLDLAVSGRRGREGRSSVASHLGTYVDRVTVPTRRLDSYGLKDVRILKIDVEGHELAVLRGAQALLDRDHPVLVVELEARHGEVGPAMEMLGSIGYRSFVLSEGSWRQVEPEELARRQRAALEGGRRDGYIASAFRRSDSYVNNVIFVHPESGWRPG